MKRLIYLLLLTALLVTAPAAAQEEVDPCANAANQVQTLLVLAQDYIANGDNTTADALVAGARALANRCFSDTAAAPASTVQMLEFGQGFGASKGFWQVYFTAPSGSTDRRTYTGGVDTAIVDAINNVESTLDIAAFEWNNPALTNAVIEAHERGVQVRMVVDDEHTLEDEDSTIEDILDEDIPVRDDSRGGLMHNKFMIMDSQTVVMGSMNFTVNGTYRNNNNVLVLTAPEAVQAYQTEFNEMFERGQFGSSRSAVNSVSFEQDGTPITVLFAPEDRVVPTMLDVLRSADAHIRFMTFSFTLDEVGQLLLDLSATGVEVEGVFETRGSRVSFSELPLLFCAGLNVREDGNPFTFHHKVFIVDDHTVLTGSFNISDSATNSNDENMVIIQDRDLAAQYIAEFERVFAQGNVPPRDAITCPR
ncbi:MAG: phospholipase D-like domain-containing protein [Anaerolineae bacterium]